jgi:hypothetical protein
MDENHGDGIVLRETADFANFLSVNSIKFDSFLFILHTIPHLYLIYNIPLPFTLCIIIFPIVKNIIP